ncbi:MAG: glycosyl transferase family 1 [Alteromonas sp.]|nr:glycosyl transferase family 1 [Alteromonas sp.]MAY22116.1 glycosyl transferase family 1 [Flavobacteriaceae bacterium]|tara:strand:+ start:680 stop:1969 length:1290 start_codon:yes stop_codon:yes gene_type:complete
MKRVLIICYYWPPAGGPGVQRWLKFVKYFRDFGVEPVLYIPKNPNYPVTDTSLSEEIPKGLEVLQKKIREPYKYAQLFSKKKTQKMSSGIIEEKNPSALEKLMLFARGNLFIPDARVGWVRPSVAFLKNYLTENKDIETVITTGPPHSLHLIGMQLKENLGIRWIADFRDPWTTIHYHKSLRLTKSAQKKHKRMEREVLQSADTIVVTSPSTQRDFQKMTNRPVALITNGFDTISLDEKINRDEKFSLVHIGSLLSNRNPKLLWETLSEICLENAQFKEDLVIKLVGLVSKEVKDTIASVGLSEKLELPGYVSHQEAQQYQHKAQVLLLVEMNKAETQVILPGKLFEYLRAKRPILAIGPEGSDIEPILEDVGAGVFFGYSDKEKLKEQLIQHYQNYQDNALENLSVAIEQYHRKALTEKYAQLIKRLS